MIETKLEGDPAAVRAAATWVSDTLRAKVGEAGERGTSARQRAGRDWEGAAAEAYRDVASQVIDAGDEQEEHLGRVAEKFRTYAVKLTHAQEHMADRRAEATEGGLTVAGTVIQTPPEPQRPADLPAGSTEAERTAWDAENDRFEQANDKVELYNRLLGEVEQERTTLDEWIDANLTHIATADDPTLLSYLVKQLQKLPATAMLFTIDLRKGRLEELANHHGSRQAARGLDALAEGSERIARRLPIVGGLLTVGLAGNDIANGDSPGQVISSEVLATGAGIAAGAIAVTAGAPVLAVAAVGTVAAVGVGMLAEYAWDHWVPEDVTEAIDEGLRDFGEGVKDTASDVWDAVTPW